MRKQRYVSDIKDYGFKIAEAKPCLSVGFFYLRRKPLSKMKITAICEQDFQITSMCEGCI